MTKTQKQAQKFMNQLQKSEELIRSLCEEVQSVTDSVLHITPNISSEAVQSSSNDKTNLVLKES